MSAMADAYECNGRRLRRLLAIVAGGRSRRRVGEGRGMISEVEKREGGSKSKEKKRGGEGPVTGRGPGGAFASPKLPRMKFVIACNFSLRTLWPH